MLVSSASQKYVQVSRRQVLAGLAGLGAAGALPRHAWAQAAPHTFAQGDFEITVVSDGHLVLPSNILGPDAPPEERQALLEALGVSDTFEAPTNAPLIRAGSDLILVDNGSGGEFQPETSGKLADNLIAAGIDPGSITKVVFTHAHPDHIWATVSEGELRYPNAAYYVAAAEWDFWTNPDLKSQMPQEMHGFIDGAVKHLTAVQDRVTMVKAGDNIVTGIGVLETAGHTPGHISLEVAGGEGLIITGDALPGPAGVYFPHPDWTLGFDLDPAMAVTKRTAMLDRAATDKMKMLGYHWTYPGVGFAERDGTAYRFVPA
jgi:glyoxylase-like metal-dependent hydrolase (beta-lactamase superfamily II)